MAKLINNRTNNSNNNLSFIKTESYHIGTYTGTFKNDLKHGKGKYTWNDGNVYEGDWINGERTGKGKYTWRNGDIFVGDFNKGLKGKGRMYFKSSGKREFGEYNKRGEWKNIRRL